MMRKGTPNHRSCAASARPVGPAPTIKQGAVSDGFKAEPGWPRDKDVARCSDEIAKLSRDAAPVRQAGLRASRQ